MNLDNLQEENRQIKLNNIQKAEEDKKITEKAIQLLEADGKKIEATFLQDIKPYIKPAIEQIKIQEAEEQINKIREEYKTLLLLKKSGSATELLVEYIKQKEHIYTTRDDIKSEMWIYKEGIYTPQGRTYIKEWMRQLLKEIYTEHKANEVIAKIEADTYIEGKQFFNQISINEICVGNGILNIITKKLEPYTPKKIFFNKIKINYNPTLKCPHIIKHLQTVLKNETDIPVMQELFGYCLLKEYRFEKAFMFVGTGRNGKSKTIELLKTFIGIESCSTVTLKELENNFSKQELFNKMINIAGDISNETIKDSSWFKGLTGRDMMGADRKFLNKIYFTNYAKLIFSANELPKTYDISPAFWNRWIILEFPYIFKSKKEIENLALSERLNVKEMDELIVQKITSPEELCGLLNWSLEGLDRLLTNKDFSYSKSVNQVRDFWIRKSDSFMAFCLDELEFDNESFMRKQDLRKFYNDYCKLHKIKTQGDKSIKNTLDIHFGVAENRKLIDMEQTMIWEGVRLKSKPLDNDDKIRQGFSTFQIAIGKKNSLDEFKNGCNPIYFSDNTIKRNKGEETSISFEELQSILLEKPDGWEILEAIKFGFTDQQLVDWKGEGLIFESPSGVIRLV